MLLAQLLEHRDQLRQGRDHGFGPSLKGAALCLQHTCGQYTLGWSGSQSWAYLIAAVQFPKTGYRAS